MAYPKVFVSSTCYDLGQVRDNLLNFIKSFYFEPVLSERGDIFYNPDLNTHECCINEVGNCDLFILLIGGRFGGSYVYDTSKSIVNAEYSAARQNEIPVFTFVKREVYEDHRVYLKNKNDKSIIERIVFPSIEKQEYSLKIFEFIDEVRNTKVNNGIFSFEFERDIESLLGKQWSGMFYEFLQKRKSNKQFELTTNLLNNLTIASQKTEDLLKSMYIHIGKEEAKQVIDSIDIEANAKQFFILLKEKLRIDKLTIRDYTSAINSTDSKPWYEFAQLFSSIYLDEGVHISVNGNDYECDLLLDEDSKGLIIVSNFTDDYDRQTYNEFGSLYDCYMKLNSDQKSKIIHEIVKE